MSIPGQSAWQIIEDGLYQLLLEASPTAIGGQGGVLAVQPNPDGSTGLKLLARTTPPEQALFPSIGMQCSGFTEQPSASGTDDSIATYDVVVSVQVQQDPTVTDTGNAALQNLRNYMNDGLGNGIEPLLRFNSDILGLCQWSTIKRMQRYLLASESGAADAIAVAIYTVEAHMQLRAFV